jgi:bacteriorhodopsin
LPIICAVFAPYLRRICAVFAPYLRRICALLAMTLRHFFKQPGQQPRLIIKYFIENTAMAGYVSLLSPYTLIPLIIELY